MKYIFFFFAFFFFSLTDTSYAAISLVNSSSFSVSTTFTMPTHQAGDLIVVTAVNSNGTTPPIVPSGWNVISTGSSNPSGSVSDLSIATAYIIADSSSETSGTWSSSQFVVSVYRSDNFDILLGNYSQTIRSTTAAALFYDSFSFLSADSPSLVHLVGGFSNSLATTGVPPGFTAGASGTTPRVAFTSYNLATTSFSGYSSSTITTSAVTQAIQFYEVVPPEPPTGLTNAVEVRSDGYEITGTNISFPELFCYWLTNQATSTGSYYFRSEYSTTDPLADAAYTLLGDSTGNCGNLQGETFDMASTTAESSLGFDGAPSVSYVRYTWSEFYLSTSTNTITLVKNGSTFTPYNPPPIPDPGTFLGGLNIVYSALFATRFLDVDNIAYNATTSTLSFDVGTYINEQEFDSTANDRFIDRIRVRYGNFASSTLTLGSTYEFTPVFDNSTTTLEVWPLSDGVWTLIVDFSNSRFPFTNILPFVGTSIQFDIEIDGGVVVASQVDVPLSPISDFQSGQDPVNIFNRVLSFFNNILETKHPFAWFFQTLEVVKSVSAIPQDEQDIAVVLDMAYIITSATSSSGYFDYKQFQGAVGSSSIVNATPVTTACDYMNFPTFDTCGNMRVIISYALYAALIVLIGTLMLRIISVKEE